MSEETKNVTVEQIAEIQKRAGNMIESIMDTNQNPYTNAKELLNRVLGEFDDPENDDYPAGIHNGDMDILDNRLKRLCFLEHEFIMNKRDYMDDLMIFRANRYTEVSPLMASVVDLITDQTFIEVYNIAASSNKELGDYESFIKKMIDMTEEVVNNG